MAKTTRRYTEKTIKLLFGSCGNQCAEPNCTNEIIVAGTQHSDAAVIGQICHIYAAADNGPRGKPGLTEKERNAPDNLILLCGHHHPIVDKQWQTYPAETLKSWKKAHEAKFQKRTTEAAQQQASMQRLSLLAAYSDEQINVELDRIRRGRFLPSFPTKEDALVLATRVDAAEFSGGSSQVRARALAWCARLLSQGDTSSAARAFLHKSKSLEHSEETALAEAFFLATSDKNAALAMLAQIATPASRSAALRIVTNQDSATGAIAWLDEAGIGLDDLDPEGKLAHLMNELSVEDWQRATITADQITEDDFKAAPVLYQAVAMAELAKAAPVELRTSLLSQIPFEAHRFPLASDEEALAARRRAAELFGRGSEFAQTVGAVEAAYRASDYVLWLRLRDPRDHADGMDELRASMRDPAHSLRRLNLALQFGVKLDLDAIERQIEQRIALSGKGTADEAFARFSLAFTQENPRAAAEYIARHRAQLYEFLNKASIQPIEIELLARAGLIEQANEQLVQAVADGLGDREQQSLRQIIAEAQGVDPAAARKKLYEQTDELRDLVNLVRFLEERRSWIELLPYAKTLFARTRSLEDASLVAITLNASADYGGLYDFLSAHQDLLTQSPRMKALWAWSLYREGRFVEATAVLTELSATRDDPNDRALRVNIAIASGDWEDLVGYSSSEWNNRDQRTPAELLSAGQLAQAVNGPHARDLVTSAAERAADDPAILAAAYFYATGAGWEQIPAVGEWLNRAAKLSSVSGPLKSVSMKELLDQKPEWEKRESSVWEQLNMGEMPMFGAAHMLHRSLVDFTLLQSLANLNEPDPRRRGVVYAYSGARPGFSVPKVERIALDLVTIITLGRLELLDTVLSSYRDIVIPNSTLGWLFKERKSAQFHQPSRIKDAHLLKRLVAAKSVEILTPHTAPDHPLSLQVGGGLAGLLLAAQSRTFSGDGVPRYVIRSAPVHRLGSLMEEEADLSAYAHLLCSCQSVVAKVRAKGLLTATEEEHAHSYLKLHESSWPSEPLIADGAELYLDDLSVTYLRTVGVLDKLQPSGLKVYITENEDAEANRLIAYEALADRQLEVIESIRRSLARGLKSGRVRATRSREVEEGEMLSMHPTFAVLSIGENVDAFVVDDRFVNRHQHMTQDGRQTPILTTLDLLDDLASRAAITLSTLFECRTSLRRAGYQLVPIREDELFFHLDRARLHEGAFVETAELRAIRESLLRLRMKKMLQIPGEVPWVQKSMSAVARCIRRIWQSKAERNEAAAYAQWLLGLLDVRGFAASALTGNERAFALYAYAGQILQLMTPLNEVSAATEDAYYDWIDTAILEEIKQTQPEVFVWLVEQARALIAHSTQTAIGKLEG